MAWLDHNSPAMHSSLRVLGVLRSAALLGNKLNILMQSDKPGRKSDAKDPDELASVNFVTI